MKSKSVKVIFDTNVWISFLIGKRLAKLKHHISNGRLFGNWRQGFIET